MGWITGSINPRTCRKTHSNYPAKWPSVCFCPWGARLIWHQTRIAFKQNQKISQFHTISGSKLICGTKLDLFVISVFEIRSNPVTAKNKTYPYQQDNECQGPHSALGPWGRQLMSNGSKRSKAKTTTCIKHACQVCLHVRCKHQLHTTCRCCIRLRFELAASYIRQCRNTKPDKT